MPDLNKRRKKDEVERYTDTGTGSKPKTAAIKPGGAPLHLNSKPAATSTRTTPKVEKPGLARSGGITRQTDTGTGGEELKRRAQNQQDIRLDRARDEAAQRAEERKDQLRATRERLGQQTFEEKGYESRKERESRAPRSSGSKGSRSSGKKENTGSTSMTGKEYLEYVYEAKKRQQEQDVEAIRAIDSYKRNRYLVGLDVGQAEKELAQLEDWLDKGVNTERRRWDLNAAYNNGGRDGETYQAALAQYGQAAAEAEETKAKIAQLKQDIEQAKSAQYYEKGVAALDDVKKYHYNAWKNIDALAQRAMPDTGEALPASENGTFDVDPNAIAQLSAEADKARAELRRLGYKDEDISKLVDYRLRQLNNERTAAALAQAQEFAKTHPFAASAASVATNIGSGLGVLDAAVQRLRNPDRPYDYNSESMLASNWTNAVRTQVSKDIVSSANDRGRSGAVGNFLYQTGMSMADSMVNMGLAAVGMPEALGLIILGGSAATASMREAHERGLSDAQALGIGLISGIAEYATEKISWDTLFETMKMKGAQRQSATRALLTNALAEGGEEVASDVINFVADQIVAQDASEFRKNVESYKNLGFTDAEAVASALKDQLGDTALSFLGGALSGGVMGAGGHIVSGITNNHYNQMLVGAMTLEDSSPVKTAAVAVRELNHQISTEMMQKGLDEPTEAQSKQLQEAYSAFSEALQQADEQTRKLVEEQGKKAYRAEKQQYRADKKALRQEAKANKKASPQIMARVNEALNSGSLQFSENATVQEAASLLARDRYAVNEATGKVLADPEAKQELNLSFPEGTNIPEQKRAARLALQSLIDSTKASTAEQMQAEEQTAEQTEAAAETESTEPAAVSAENAEQAAEVQEAVEQEAEDEEIDLADAELLTKEEHEELLLKQNPDMTREQLDEEYEAMVSAHRNAEVRRDIQDRTGKMTMVGGRALSYRTFRSLAQQNAAAKGQTLEEDVIRRAFDTGAEETSEEVKKYEEERKADLEDTVKRINEASVLKNWGYKVRVSYDTEHDFVSKKVQENAFVDSKNKEIVFNGNRMDSGAMIMYVLGHEVTHKAAEVDKTLVKNIIDTFTELANDGKLNAQLTYKMRNIDAELEKLRKLYQMHEDERAAVRNRKPKTISLDDVREEFAADLMRDAFMQTKLYQEIVSKNADLAMKMRETLKRVLRAITGDGRKSRAVQKALQKIADQEDAALARITTDDSTLNKDAEDVTADNLTTKQLEEVKDTHGDEMFSLGTMKQDLNNYMQDLRDADLVGEGKVMTEEELTGLYNSINKVMNFVEDHIDEIERNEHYRNMTAENRPFSPYKPNSDPHYKMALDFSTLCRKRLLTQAITERLQKALGRALTPVEQVKIRDMLKKLQAEGKKIDVACALCYVEAARLKSPKVINDFLTHRADNIWNYHSLQDKTFKNDVYAKRSGDWKEQHGLPRNATKAEIKAAGYSVNEYNKFMLAVRQNYRKWLQQNNPERYAELEKAVADAEAMPAAEFLSAQSLARMRQDNPDLYDTFITKVRQATRSKAQETDVPYVRGDVNQVGEALIEQMNEESGFRHQSWSDFQAMHLLDSIAAIIELSTRKAKMHTYTKVPDMVRFLGNTGMMMNMSLIPAGDTGFDENGNLLFDPVEGMDYQTMLDLRRKFHSTAGNIAIGISDAQILAMMASDEIDYIIPYHTSGLNADMRKRMGIRKWADYTKSQNEKGDDWEHKAPHLREWYNEKEALLAPDGVAYMVEASKKYLQLCHERGLVPKFAQFLQKNSDGSYSLRDDAQNYWKLLIDRKMVDQYTGGVIQQKAVVPRFDEDTMLDILNNEVNSQAARDAREAEDYIVNKVLENGEGIVSKAERAELENRARILRDAALRGVVQTAAGEMGIGENDRQFSIAYSHAASDSARRGLQQAQDMLWDYQYEHPSNSPFVPFEVMEDIRAKTGWWRSPVDRQWRYWISDKDAGWNTDNRDLASDTGELFQLYDVIKHDKLFQDYPQLEDVEVMFYLPKGGSTQGEFSIKGDQWVINLQEGAELNDDTFATLLHEIQHAIQQIEVDQGNRLQNGSNVDVGYKQAFVVAYNDITDDGQDTSMFAGLSYKQAVRKIEQRIAKLYRNSSGFTDAERQRMIDAGMSEESMQEWEAAERADRSHEDVRGAVQASAYEYYREAIGEIDARFTGDMYQVGVLTDLRNDAAAEENIPDRVRYGEETRRGDHDSVLYDALNFKRISKSLGWDGKPEHLHSSNYDLAESRGSRAEDDRQYSLYHNTALLKESTVDKYLADYAAKSSPNYAQAYIAWMDPRAFLNLTTSRIGRLYVENESTDLDEERFAEASQYQPLQLRIDHETGEVEGHEGRHRCVGLMRAGVMSVPVLLFDSSNKYSKETIPELTLQGQDFGSSRSYATRSVENLMPLNYANRDAIIKEFATKSTDQKMAEKYLDERTLQFSIENIDGESIPTVRLGEAEANSYQAAKAYLEYISGYPDVFARTLDGATSVYLGEDLPGEYTASEYTRAMDSKGRKAKMNAVGILDEMILLGENGWWDKNLDPKHEIDAANGFTRFDTKFGIEQPDGNVDVYKGVLLLRHDADGRTYLYDLLNVEKEKTAPMVRDRAGLSDRNNAPGVDGGSSSSGEQYTTESEDVNSDFSITLRPEAEGEQYEYDPNDDPVMQAFFDAYEEARGNGQTRKDFPTIEQRLREAERDLKRAEKKANLESAKRWLYSREDKKEFQKKLEKDREKNRKAWEMYYKRRLRTRDREWRAKLDKARRDKIDALKAQKDRFQEQRAIDKAEAEVKLEATKMAMGREAAKRLHVKEDLYKAKQAKQKEKAILRRNAAKAALRDRSLNQKKRAEAEIEQGPVETLRKTAAERKAMLQRETAAGKLRTLGRDLYTKFVSAASHIERFARRQKDGMRADTLATVAGGVGSTVNRIFTDGLVDRAGNRIGDSMTDVFLCTKDDKGKVIDEPRQQLFQDYLLHRHNIDRMSFVSRAEANLEAFEREHPWLKEMDAKEFARLVALSDTETQKLGQEEARSLARAYQGLLQDLNNARDKAVFADKQGQAVTAETSRAIVKDYEAAHPWLKEKAENLYRWWDRFMKEWVVGDSITEEQYARMRSLYPSYVPTYRVIEGMPGFSFSSSKGATPGQLVKRATGSFKEIINIEDSFANLVQKAVKQARVNELYKNIVDTAMLDFDGTFADLAYFDWLEYAQQNHMSEDELEQYLGDTLATGDQAGLTKVGKDHKVSAWYNGQLIGAYVSPDLFNSLALTVGHTSDRLDKAAKLGSKLTSPMKTAITGINPNFALRNMARDLPTAVINSTSGLAFPYWWGVAWKNMVSNSENWQHYQALGGGDALYYNNEGGYGKALNMDDGAKGKLQRGWNKTKEVVGFINERTEAVTRFAEYLATINKLGDTYEGRLQGMKNAAEVTVDFSRHGEYGKAINAWIPYWNPAVQGIDKVFRSVLDTPQGQTRVGHLLRVGGRLAVTTALAEAVQQIILAALGRDKDWEELNDRAKDTYYYIPLPEEHKFIRIPKNREWGAILGTPLMRLWEGFNGRENPFENYLETSIIPNFLPGSPLDTVGISQAFDIATNKDFAGRTIVPYAYQQGSKKGQYDSDTSAVAKWLSDALGNALSPMQIDYIVKDYYGDFGKMFTMLTSRGLWSGDKDPEEVGEYLLDVVRNPWVSDSRISNYYTSKYYEVYGKLEDEYNDLKNHAEGKDYKESKAYKTYTALKELYGNDISELSKSIREESDDNVKAVVKGQIAQLAKQALEFYDQCMSGDVKEPELTAKYYSLSDSVSQELIRMNKYAEDYAFAPQEATAKTITDTSSLKLGNTYTKEYKLDDAAIEQRNALRETEYNEAMQSLIRSSEYASASDKKKAEMLEDARSNAYEAADDSFRQWLSTNRAPTLKEKLPEEYTSLSKETQTELARLSGVDGTAKYKYTPSASTTSSYGDPDSKVGRSMTREYVLDDEAKDIYNEKRRELYEQYIRNEMKKARYANASDLQKAEYLEAARDAAYEDAKEWFMSWLKKNRTSTPKD